VAVEDAWFDRAQPLSIEVRTTVPGRAPWAVQLFTPTGDAADDPRNAGADHA
jgi:type VI secretion system protein ImpJ